MFKITPSPTFWAPVGLSVPGEPAPVVVDFCFKHLQREVLQDFFDRCSNGLKAQDALAEVVVDWRGMDKPFAQDALAELLRNYVPSGQEIFAAFRRESVDSRVKN